MLITEHVVNKDGTVEVRERPLAEEEKKHIYQYRIAERLKETVPIQTQIDAMLVDHEYRLILAEEGVNA